jgi:hypothetical protein
MLIVFHNTVNNPVTSELKYHELVVYSHMQSAYDCCSEKFFMSRCAQILLPPQYDIDG